jgi:tripartite-type tricarboxylate transporter receptor subunit TctC
MLISSWSRSFVAIALACVAQGALAQAYPLKPIRLVVGFTPSGGVDINARLLGPKLTEYLGQQVIIENRPGAGTNIANELVAKSPPDGYTLLVNTAAVAINLSLYKKVPYEARDFPLANLGPKRSDQLPQVPTMKEAGIPGVEVVVWYGIFAPAATPHDVVVKLGDAIARAARAPDMQRKLQDLGAEPVGNTPEEFGKLYREEVTRWAEVVKVSGARAD